MNKLKIILFTIFPFVFLRGQGQSIEKTVDSLLTKLHLEEGFDGNVMVTEKGHVLYQKSFGYAVAESNELLTDKTIFSLASVSKMFTGVAAIKLVEQGKLRLDEDLQKYFPDLLYEHITIYNLLTHTSGLEEYFAPSVRNALGDKPTNTEIEKIYSKAHLKEKFPPDSNWSYSNTNFMLLALIIEKASGMSYPSFLKQYIFKPAKMGSSFVLKKNAPASKKNDIAAIYNYPSFLSVNPINVDSITAAKKYYAIIENSYGDGSIFSTIGDLFRFHEALIRGKILNAKSQQLLYAPVILPNGKSYEAGNANADYSSGYGLGCQVSRDTSLGKIIWHTGSNPGTLTFFMRNITRDQCVIILNNNWYRGTFHLGGSIMNIINGRKLQLMASSLARKIGKEYTLNGPDSAIHLLDSLKGEKDYHIGLLEMNQLGYDLLAIKDYKSAIAVFTVNTDTYPTNGDIWDSLAEAYLKNGEKEKAIKLYQKSVELNPNNEGGKKALEELLKK